MGDEWRHWVENWVIGLLPLGLWLALLAFFPADKKEVE